MAHSPVSDIGDMLRTTELQSCGEASNFLDLPAELRQRVLQFTDLVAPVREVMWNGYQFDCYDPRTYDDSRTHYYSESDLRAGLVYLPGVYFCPPISLFLVCHTMTEDARQVFYSSNRFALIFDPETDMGRFFTRPGSTHCLRHLRDIEIVFNDDFNYVRDEQLVELKESFDLLAQHMGRLSIAVYFDCDPPEDALSSFGLSIRALLFTSFKAQSKFIELLLPLQHNLAAFHVYATPSDREGAPQRSPEE